MDDPAPIPPIGWVQGLLIVLVIVGVVGGMYLIGFAVTAVFGLPLEMNLHPAFRLAGVALFIAGAAFFGWLLRYRRMRDILASTYASIAKAGRRVPLGEAHGRTEPLVVVGPYRIVRHPLYFAVGLMVVAIALLVDLTAALLGAVFLWLWFAFVVEPFEERELLALFGPPYLQYMRVTPRMIPVPRRTRRSMPGNK